MEDLFLSAVFRWCLRPKTAFLLQEKEMKTARKISALMVLMISVTLSRQDASVVGRVIDAETKRPLESANILFEGTTLGASSDKEGNFAFEQVPLGRQTLVVSYVGYGTMRKILEVTSGSAAVLEFALSPVILPGQTIVVMAMRGRERETPATFATLGAKDLADRYNTQDIPQLLSELPSTTFYSENGNGIGYNYLNIRGFDQRRISVMINGVPQNDPEDHNVYWLDFPDLAANLQDLQVQRGAGSAFYGPAAIGGSVNLITTNFASTPSMSLSTGYGGFNTRKYSVQVQSGLIDSRYAIQARLSRIRSEGYREKSWADFSSYFLGLVRYDESMTTQFNFYGGPVADGLAYAGIPKEDLRDKDLRRKNYSYWEPGYFVPRRAEEIENFSQPHYEFLHEWRIDDQVTLNNTLFVVTGEGFFDYDGSWAPYSYYRITPQNGFPVSGDPDTLYVANALIHAWVGNVQYGWLPRAFIRHDNGELTVGIEARIHRSLHWGSLRWGEGLPAGVTPDYRYYEYRGAKNIFSLYLHELYSLRPDLNLLVDLQYAYNQYRLYDEKYVGTNFSVPYHFINPRIGVNYNLSERLNLYGQISHTSREPRLKNLYDAAEVTGGEEPQFRQTAGGYDFSQPLVKPERLTDIEIGAGYSDADFRATANLFYMDFSNEIVKSGQLDRFGQPITGNAEKTRHVGIELTGLVRFGALELRGNMTLSRNRLVRYTVFDGGGLPQKLDGNTIAGFPDFLANTSMSYSSSGFSGTLMMQHVGRFFTDNFQNPGSRAADPARTVDAYTVFNGWLSYQIPVGAMGHSVEVRLQVNNILNKLYFAHGEGGDFFPAATRNIFASLQISL